MKFHDDEHMLLYHATTLHLKNKRKEQSTLQSHLQEVSAHHFLIDVYPGQLEMAKEELRAQQEVGGYGLQVFSQVVAGFPGQVAQLATHHVDQPTQQEVGVNSHTWLHLEAELCHMSLPHVFNL